MGMVVTVVKKVVGTVKEIAFVESLTVAVTNVTPGSVIVPESTDVKVLVVVVVVKEMKI